MWIFIFTTFLLNAHAGEDLRPTIWTKGYYNSAIQTVFPPGQYRYADQEARELAEADEGYLPPLKRDALFRKVGIETKLQQLDQMDKDMLVMGAKVYTAPELRKQYPMLSLKELTRLKREMEKVK